MLCEYYASITRNLHRSWAYVEHRLVHCELRHGMNHDVPVEQVCPAQASDTAEVEREHEKFLVEFVGAGAPVFLTDFPRELKPFYMKPNSDERTVCQPPAYPLPAFD